MARPKRLVIPGCPHHITQRGNRGQAVFFEDTDRERYLQVLTEHAAAERVRLWAYCLMTNHIHLIAVPSDERTFSRWMKRVQLSHAAWINRRHERTGHLWQSRFFSCPMDEAHTWYALRYVELNPVRAGLAASAAEYRWSSARTHLGVVKPDHNLDCEAWREQFNAHTWAAWLRDPEAEKTNARIRAATLNGNRALLTPTALTLAAGQ